MSRRLGERAVLRTICVGQVWTERRVGVLWLVKQVHRKDRQAQIITVDPASGELVSRYVTFMELGLGYER